MGGGGPQRIGDLDANRIRTVGTQIQQGVNRDIVPLAERAATALGNNLNTFNAGYKSNFQAGGYSPDTYTQGILGQGEQAMRNNVAAVQRELQSRFANNPAMARVLGAQASVNGQLSQNPLTLQAAIAQRGRQVEEQNLTNQSLAQQLGLQNATLSNQLQMASVPMQAQQNLLQTLVALGQTPGLENTTRKVLPLNPFNSSNPAIR